MENSLQKERAEKTSSSSFASRSTSDLAQSVFQPLPDLPYTLNLGYQPLSIPPNQTSSLPKTYTTTSIALPQSHSPTISSVIYSTSAKTLAIPTITCSTNPFLHPRSRHRSIFSPTTKSFPPWTFQSIHLPLTTTSPWTYGYGCSYLAHIFGYRQFGQSSDDGTGRTNPRTPGYRTHGRRSLILKPNTPPHPPYMDQNRFFTLEDIPPSKWRARLLEILAWAQVQLQKP